MLTAVASNGQEALDRIAHARPDGAYDAILMDLEMPSMSRALHPDTISVLTPSHGRPHGS